MKYVGSCCVFLDFDIFASWCSDVVSVAFCVGARDKGTAVDCAACGATALCWSWCSSAHVRTLHTIQRALYRNMPRRKSTAAKAKGVNEAPSSGNNARGQPSKSRHSLKLDAPAQGKAKPQSVLLTCAVLLAAFAVWRRTLARQESIPLLKHDQATCKDECWVSEKGEEADPIETSFRWMRRNLDQCDASLLLVVHLRELSSGGVRRHVKQGKTCAVKGVRPSVPHQHLVVWC